MLINQGILQKALLLNKKLFTPLLFAAMVLFSARAVFPLDKKTAFLESGPVPCIGMPGIGINVISGYSGIYKIPANDTDDEKTLYIYFTNTVIPIFESWKIAKTKSQTVYQTQENNILIYRHFNGWTLFVEFKDFSDISEKDIFAFFDEMIEQMIFFIKSGDDFLNASFPAIIEY
jgi:hypothetical protein